jgi:hypothetical protein
MTSLPPKLLVKNLGIPVAQTLSCSIERGCTPAAEEAASARRSWTSVLELDPQSLKVQDADVKGHGVEALLLEVSLDLDARLLVEGEKAKVTLPVVLASPFFLSIEQLCPRRKA